MDVVCECCHPYRSSDCLKIWKNREHTVIPRSVLKGMNRATKTSDTQTRTCDDRPWRRSALPRRARWRTVGNDPCRFGRTTIGLSQARCYCDSSSQSVLCKCRQYRRGGSGNRPSLCGILRARAELLITARSPSEPIPCQGSSEGSP